MLITIGTSVEGSRESEFSQLLPHAPDPESDGWDRFEDIMMEPVMKSKHNVTSSSRSKPWLLRSGNVGARALAHSVFCVRKMKVNDSEFIMSHVTNVTY